MVCRFWGTKYSPLLRNWRGRKIQPSATKWNILGTNDASFNDGTGVLPTVTTFTNTGTAGGTSTFFYRAIGTIKEFWGKTGVQTSGATGNSYTITLPGSYFSTVRSVTSTAIDMTADARQYIAVNSATTVTVTLTFIAPNGAATTAASVYIKGT